MDDHIRDQRTLQFLPTAKAQEESCIPFTDLLEDARIAIEPKALLQAESPGSEFFKGFVGTDQGCSVYETSEVHGECESAP